MIDMREIETAREFYESTNPESVANFVKNGILDQARFVARTIDPSLSYYEIENAKSNLDVAKALGKTTVPSPTWVFVISLSKVLSDEQVK